MRIVNTGKNTLSRYISPQKADNIRLENTVFTENGVACRPGFTALADKRIFINDGTFPGEMSFIATDCYVRVNGKLGRVTVSVEDNLMTSVIYNMKLVFADGSVTDIGSLEFTRVSYDAFGYPASFTVFSGEPTRGCGIYILVRKVYSNDLYQDYVMLCELSEDMTEWSLMQDSDMYVPTLLKNGRGDGYYAAMPLGQSLNLPAPVYPESKNLLTGGFKAYYTADGTSYSFTLPLSGLDDGLIYCRVSYIGEEYEFRIYGGAESSEDVILADSTSVSMLCDRTEGRIYFKTSAGLDYAMPYSGKLNDIYVTAYKTVEADAVKAASMSSAVAAEGLSLSEEGTVTCFYSSTLYPSLILTNSPLHPLYFPSDGQHFLGESGVPVTEVLSVGRRLVAFKEEEVYACTAEGYQSGQDALTMNFVKVCQLYVRPVRKSICLAGGELLFLTEKGELYSLKGSGTSAHTLKYEAELPEQPDPDGFALAFGENYMYISADRVFAADLSGSAPVCSLWTLPAVAVGGMAADGDIVLFAQMKENGVYMVYPAVFSGNEDTVMTNGTGSILPGTAKICGSYFCDLLERGARRYRLYRLRIFGEGEAEVRLYSENRREALRRVLFRRGRADIQYGCNAFSPKAEFRLTGDAVLEGIAVEYAKLN